MGVSEPGRETNKECGLGEVRDCKFINNLIFKINFF